MCVHKCYIHSAACKGFRDPVFVHIFVMAVFCWKFYIIESVHKHLSVPNNTFTKHNLYLKCKWRKATYVWDHFKHPKQKKKESSWDLHCNKKRQMRQATCPEELWQILFTLCTWDYYLRKKQRVVTPNTDLVITVYCKLWYFSRTN